MAETWRMAKTQESLAFSQRLRQVLKRSPKKITTPSELALQFNLHHQGGQVTNQAAQKWMAGETKPTADKIETLAAMFSVSAQWLRYGIPETKTARKPVSQGLPAKRDALSPLELKMLSRFQLLSEYQRELVVDLVEQLALDREMWSGTS